MHCRLSISFLCVYLFFVVVVNIESMLLLKIRTEMCNVKLSVDVTEGFHVTILMSFSQKIL